MTLQAVAKIYKMGPRQCTLVRYTERWPQADAQKKTAPQRRFFFVCRFGKSSPITSYALPVMG